MSVNTKMRDSTIAHLIDLHRFSNGEVRAMLKLLNEADADLFARLRAALERMGTEFSVRRLATLLEGVWSANEGAYRQLSARSKEQMQELTTYELEFQQNLFQSLLPRELSVSIASVEAKAAYAASAAHPFQGKLLSEWFDSLATSRRNRISTMLNIGFVSGKTVDEMIRDLRGTRAQNYADGLLEIDRRNAEAVVRTATSHTASFARQQFFKANEDLIAEEQWVSTLDNRTSETCQIRDGLLYTAVDHDPVDHKIPWGEGPGLIHWNCRSTSVPVIDSAKALGIELPPLERAAMNGVAAPGTTFKEWLESRSASMQDDILGPTRGALLRQGKLSFDRFFNDKGVFLTLDQLRSRDAAAFGRAGL